MPAYYDLAEDFSEGLAVVRMTKNWGFINKQGVEVIPLYYDFVSSFKNGLATVCIKDKWGMIDKIGNELIPLKFNTIKVCEDGIFIGRQGIKQVYFDKNGNYL